MSDAELHAQHAYDASRKAICAYPPCGVGFTPRKSWQIYHTPECRVAANKLRDDGGLRGVVSSVRVLKRGRVSVVVRFEADEREHALGLEPGKVVEVLHEVKGRTA